MRLVREIVWQLVNAWMLANANYEMLKFFATCFYWNILKEVENYTNYTNTQLDQRHSEAAYELVRICILVYDISGRNS